MNLHAWSWIQTAVKTAFDSLLNSNKKKLFGLYQRNKIIKHTLNKIICTIENEDYLKKCVITVSLLINKLNTLSVNILRRFSLFIY